MVKNVMVEEDEEALRSMGWREIWLKEDWWAIWLGLGIVVVAYLFFANGSSIKWIAITPGKWSTLDQLLGDFRSHITQYVAQFIMWLVVLSLSMRIMGHKISELIPSFVFIYLISIAIFMIGAWEQAHQYNLEPPLVALLLGMLISNLIGLPRWMELTTRFRELASATGKPFWAFTVGVGFNVALGFILSALVFGTYWANLAH